jgi:hypothetical protein
MPTEPHPISLSDSQMDSVIRATAPMEPHQRSAFLASLAHLLRGEPVIGDGLLHRRIRELLRQGFWTPPTQTAGPQSTRRSVGEPLA